ncbi:MAG: hypothetical protein GY757_18670, partial [bacterium]|nr:hypothetical protein [bacterium]
TGTTSQPTGKKKSLIALLIFAIAVIVMGTVLIITQKEPADPKTSQTEILNRQIENKETLLVDNGGSEEVSTAKKEDITLLGESITAKTEPAGALEKKTPGKSPTETPKSGKIQLKGNEPGQVGLKSVDVGQSQGWKRKGSPRQGKEKGKPAFVYKTKESNGAAGVVSEKELAGDYQNYLSTVMQKIVLVFPRAKFIVTGRITLSLSIDRLGNVTAGLYNETLSVIPGHGKKRLIKAILGKINRSQLLPPKDVKGNTVRLENRLVKYKVNKSVNRIILTKYE